MADCDGDRADFADRLQREKLAALAELAYGASHEINNPLANIAARAQTLLEDEPDPERRRKLAAIHRQALRAHEMIADLMLFARPPKLARARCDLAVIARQVTDEHRAQAAERAIELDCDARDAALLDGDPTQLSVALAAVVTNALEAVGIGGKVSVAVRARRDGDKSWGDVAVRDNGPGIAPQVRRHMFDPFFSGREAGRGLGFGLSKCWRIVTEHGGRIDVNDVPGGGAEFTMTLPLRPHAA